MPGKKKLPPPPKPQKRPQDLKGESILARAREGREAEKLRRMAQRREM